MQDPRVRWAIVALAAVLAVLSAVKVIGGRSQTPPVVITGAATGPPPDYGPSASFIGGSKKGRLTVEDAPGTIASAPADESPGAPDSLSQPIEVHVAGAVKHSGLYTLPAGSRVADAIHASGGPAAKADVDAVNLAERLSDGEKVYIPRHGEPGADDSAGAGNEIGNNPETASLPGHSGRSSDKLTNPSQGHVDINIAGADELQRLPGVGPAMAARIIAYRQQNGSFKSPNDLMDVSGIGPKKMARMAPFVVVR